MGNEDEGLTSAVLTEFLITLDIASIFDDPIVMFPATITTVPVPGTIWLFGSALGLLGWMRRRAA
jgi:hypothetical protein